MVLEGFTIILLRSGPNFCKKRLKYGCHIFFSLQNLKCLKIKNKCGEHLPKLVFGHICVVTLKNSILKKKNELNIGYILPLKYIDEI